MEIIWTHMARITYLEILENLHTYWTSKEIQNFNKLTEENLSQISSGKILHPHIDNNSTIRRTIIHSNVTLFYKIKEGENRLLLITFFNIRMNPKLLKGIVEILGVQTSIFSKNQSEIKNFLLSLPEIK